MAISATPNNESCGAMPVSLTPYPSPRGRGGKSEKSLGATFKVTLRLILWAAGLAASVFCNVVSAQDKSTQSATPSNQRDAPVFIDADQIEGREEDEVRAKGGVELRQLDTMIEADELIYRESKEEVEAKGNVRITTEGNVVTGPALRYNIDTCEGTMEKPELNAKQGSARGSANSLEFKGKDKYRLNIVSFTTCPLGNNDWYLRARTMDLDYTTHVGVARNAKIEFMGLPILASPYLEFPLNNQRKTGLLPPTFGTSGKSGFEITVPYYWNIAPHLDTTLYSRLLSKRGVQLNNEFRYLNEFYRGETHFEVLPDDRITRTNRYGFSWLHIHDLGRGFSGYANIQKVSDDTYFIDLSNRVSVTSQTYLPREGWLAYNGGWWTMLNRVQRFQVLQDPLNPVVTPYERIPQITVNAGRPTLHGLADFAFHGEAVNFSHPTNIVGNRFILYPSISAPFLAPFGYFTPKLGFHATHYDLRRNADPVPSSISRTMPIFSIDSSVIFERDTSIGAQNFTQTLEPRLYYLFIPFREQSVIPNFDTGIADFNFAQIFSENVFNGGDRINDANQLTLALVSRLVSPDTGQERLRAMIGQRYYFKSQQVTLDPSISPRVDKSSNILAGLTGEIVRRWNFDAAIEYAPSLSSTQKYSLGVRYQPEVGKALNLGYRFTRDDVQSGHVNPGIKQIDLSAQWPIYRNLYGVARVNYSVRDDKVIEALAGLEYNAGCWIIRTVLQRFTSATQEITSAFFIQLELNGFSSIGTNPLEALRRNIPGYTKVNEGPDQNTTGSFYDIND